MVQIDGIYDPYRSTSHQAQSDRGRAEYLARARLSYRRCCGETELPTNGVRSDYN